MDSNTAWDNLAADRALPKLRNQVQHGPAELAAFFKHAGIAHTDYERMEPWEKVVVLRQCNQWLNTGVGQ